MKYFDWSDDKNTKLLKLRDISFEDIIILIEKGSVLDIIKHPNKKKYPNQKIFFVEFENFVYAVPFVEENEVIFLKTIYPSREATSKYLGDNYEKH